MTTLSRDFENETFPFLINSDTELLLLLLPLSCSLDNTVSTLTPGTTRFKEFRGHSLGGKRAEALRMTTQFYSAPRVRIRRHVSPSPLQVVKSTLLKYRGCKSISLSVPRFLPKPTPVLFGVLFQNFPLRRYESYRSYSSLARFESCIKMSSSERSPKLFRL